MDGLIAILSVVAGILAVIAAALPLYVAYREKHVKPKESNQPSRTGPAPRSEPEA